MIAPFAAMKMIMVALLPLAETALPSIATDRSGLVMLAGMILLGWVMARLTLRRQRRTATQNRENREMSRRLERDTTPPASPLSDAPIETQRWQIAMFDLQRELKGELDSRIAVVQALSRQVDEKIETLQRLQRESATRD